MVEAARAPLAGRRPFTVDEVFRMVETGILGEDEHVELLEGELCTVSPQGPAHRTLVVELRGRLERAYGGSAHVQDHSNVRLGERSLPEPDLAVVRGRPRAYMDRLPSGADLLLVVEITVTSRDRDRRKTASYARGGVPVYWRLDVAARTLTVYEGAVADEGHYEARSVLGERDEVRAPGTSVAWTVAELLP